MPSVYEAKVKGHLKEEGVLLFLPNISDVLKNTDYNDQNKSTIDGFVNSLKTHKELAPTLEAQLDNPDIRRKFELLGSKDVVGFTAIVNGMIANPNGFAESINNYSNTPAVPAGGNPPNGAPSQANPTSVNANAANANTATPTGAPAAKDKPDPNKVDPPDADEDKMSKMMADIMKAIAKIFGGIFGIDFSGAFGDSSTNDASTPPAKPPANAPANASGKPPANTNTPAPPTENTATNGASPPATPPTPPTNNASTGAPEGKPRNGDLNSLKSMQFVGLSSPMLPPETAPTAAPVSKTPSSNASIKTPPRVNMAAAPGQ